MQEWTKSRCGGPRNRAAVMQEAEDPVPFSAFVEAVKTAGLVNTLTSNTSFTVFMPANTAFDYLGESVENNVSTAISKKELFANPTRLALILNYHIVKGKHLTDSLSDGQKLTTINDLVLTVKKAKGVTMIVNNSDNNEGHVVATITRADVPTDRFYGRAAKNGVVHEIDQLLIPVPSVAEYNVVTTVTKDSIAWKAGLRAGMRIKYVNEEAVTPPDEDLTATPSSSYTTKHGEKLVNSMHMAIEAKKPVKLKVWWGPCNTMVPTRHHLQVMTATVDTGKYSVTEKEKKNLFDKFKECLVEAFDNGDMEGRTAEQKAKAVQVSDCLYIACPRSWIGGGHGRKIDIIALFDHTTLATIAPDVVSMHTGEGARVLKFE